PTCRATASRRALPHAPTHPAAARSLLAWVPATRRALANAIVITGIGLGSAMAPLVFGPIAFALDWQSALVIGAIPAFVLGLILFFCGRDDPGTTAKNEITKPTGEAPSHVEPPKAPGLLNVSMRLATKRSLW